MEGFVCARGRALVQSIQRLGHAQDDTVTMGRFPTGASDFSLLHNIHIGPRVQAPYPVGTWAGQDVKFTIDLHLVPRLRVLGSILHWHCSFPHLNELINKYIVYFQSLTYVFMAPYLFMHHSLPLFIKWGNLYDTWNRGVNIVMTIKDVFICK
jgi:hypothetical protein